MPGSPESAFQLLTLRQSFTQGLLTADARREIGGKAHGLLSVSQALSGSDSQIPVRIPRTFVLGTSVFEAFMQRNALWEVAFSGLTDDFIGHAFQQGDIPFEVLGPLLTLVNGWATPLAVRSSGLLEDVTRHPFAGVYLTKMIPNNAHDPDTRFQKLVEAIKFVWASTYHRIAQDYAKATGLDLRDERMAVVIQEMIGERHQDRFYPELSGVARSYNYYPFSPAKPEEGVVTLSLGLGKTIVDGGEVWFYSPAHPQMPPPFKSTHELLEETQKRFWAVNLGEPPLYDPLKETEYMQLYGLREAESDGSLEHLVSTFDLQNNRLSMGMGVRGPRVLTFAPLLQLGEIPFNLAVTDVLIRCEQVMNAPVEIEFAMTFDPPQMGFLQVRPLVVPDQEHLVERVDLAGPEVVIASESVLGNGTLECIADIVYVEPDTFSMEHTQTIARELEEHNRRLLAENRPYLLIVFGRLGTLDPWLGIPVAWGQVCGARVIVEAARENARVELSQGSHYFHNIINLGVMYFSVPFTEHEAIDWQWLAQQPEVQRGRFTRHCRVSGCLRVRVDGRNSRGVVSRPPG